MTVKRLLRLAVERGASDLHLTTGVPPTMRVNGLLIKLDEPPLSPEDTSVIAKQVLSDDKLEVLHQLGEVDFSYTYPGLGIFRGNAYYQRDSLSIALRVLNTDIPTIDSLGLPQSIKTLARRSRGLVLVTGPTGSGKSTTLAAMIDQINEEQFLNVVTLEDPIEYLHHNKRSIISQREIGRDSRSFPNALRAAMRQDPDVILVGEMRDLETVKIAVTAAETGHLVLATLHTYDTSQAVSRIIDVFPSDQQQQIRVQLANTLMGVISQRLVRRSDGSGRQAVCEILVCTAAVRNLIRENKVHQLYSFIQTGSKHGMQTMDSHMQTLYEKGLISAEDAMQHAIDPETMARMLRLPLDAN